MEIALLTVEPHPQLVLPALCLLPHKVHRSPPEMSSLRDAAAADVAIVDARLDLDPARHLCRLLGTMSPSVPVAAVIEQGALVAVTVDWGLDEILLPGAGPAEVDARLRLTVGRAGLGAQVSPDPIRLGALVLDEATYTARLRGRPLNLTFKEFELLNHLVHDAGRVFTRRQLVHDVWGYDFVGGNRTVDVHIRRLRAKLGADYESLIRTVRNVGYKAVAPPVR